MKQVGGQSEKSLNLAKSSDVGLGEKKVMGIEEINKILRIKRSIYDFLAEMRGAYRDKYQNESYTT
jgi:hypothetical protein